MRLILFSWIVQDPQGRSRAFIGGEDGEGFAQRRRLAAQGHFMEGGVDQRGSLRARQAEQIPNLPAEGLILAGCEEQAGDLLAVVAGRAGKPTAEPGEEGHFSRME